MASVDIIIMGLVARIEYEPNLLNGDRKANYGNHDKFFESFINSNELLQSLLMAGWPKVAEGVWGKALEIASAYEDEHKNSIHKGTPYSFWGVTCILSGDLDMGFHLMHQALDEDKKTYGVNFKGKPAYAIVKMDHTMVAQFFRDGVRKVATFVEGKLQCYRTSRACTLNLDILRTKVLENDGLKVDVPFFLVYNFFRLKNLLHAKEEIRKNDKEAIRQNDFASLLQAQTLLGFCIVAEALFKKAQGENKKNWPRWLYCFAANNTMRLPGLAIENGADKSSKATIEINTRFNNDFKKTLEDLLNSTYTYNESNLKPDPIEEDLLILYGIRNNSAHNLDAQKLIYEKFEEISQRVLNALFFIIERSNNS